MREADGRRGEMLTGERGLEEETQEEEALSAESDIMSSHVTADFARRAPSIATAFPTLCCTNCLLPWPLFAR